MRNQAVLFPLRDRLSGNPQGLGESSNRFKMSNDIVHGLHAPRVNRLTSYVKFTYSRPANRISKLAYMPKSTKKERDPRAVARGIEIKRRRTDADLSQPEVARNLGLTRERVSQIESGDAGELERSQRLALCKLLGFEESELLMDPDSAPMEFDMPLSPDAKSIAYRWDDLPESVRVHIKGLIANTERTLREAPELAKQIYPEMPDRGKKPKPRKR